VQDSAAKQGTDTTTLLSCSTATDATCSSTPALSGFMLGFSGDLMLWKHFGVGAEVNFQPTKQNYLVLQQQIVAAGQPGYTLQSRVTFYDFNGIYQPVKSKRAALKLEGGVGGANIKFYEASTSTTSLTGTQNFSQYFGSSNHFSVHAGAGVQIYITEHAFLRPQFDIHYVTNMNQFGRNIVTEETVWLGYTFGGQ
jgi:hypothetical protein